MKKIFTLLFSSLLSLSLLAYDGVRLSVSTISTTMDIKIEVDGRRLSMQDNSITLRNLNEGYHTVKIYRDKKRNGNGWGFGFGRKQDVLYNSSVYLRRGYHTDIIINRFGKVFTDEHFIDRNDDLYNDDGDNNYDDGNNNDNGNNNGNNGGWNNGYGNVMSTSDFETAKESLRKDWFENSRLSTAKLIVDRNNFTTQQVKEMMLLFSFENNRLELAKYAYRKTVDKQNYYQLNDALTFSSSKDELARFIRESR